MEIAKLINLVGSKQRSIVEKAAFIAYYAHQDQRRKDDGSPYVLHLCMVAHILAKYGFSDVVVAAGYLHDAIEDTSLSAEDLASIVGEDVVAIVQAVSEEKALPWEDRKKRYIERVITASPEVRAVAVADKIHNIGGLLAAHAAQGDAVWSTFARGREQKVKSENGFFEAIAQVWSHPMMEELEGLVRRLSTLEK